MKTMNSMFMIIGLLVLVVLSVALQLSAQELRGSYWVIIKKDSSTISVKSKAMNIVKRDTLWLIQNGKTTKVPVDSIIQLKRVKKGTVVRGLIIGGAIGAMITAAVLTAQGWYDYGTDIRPVAINTAGLVAGAGIGALIGNAARHDKVYEFEKLSLPQKSNLIQSQCRHF